MKTYASKPQVASNNLPTSTTPQHTTAKYATLFMSGYLTGGSEIHLKANFDESFGFEEVLNHTQYPIPQWDWTSRIKHLGFTKDTNGRRVLQAHTLLTGGVTRQFKLKLDRPGEWQITYTNRGVQYEAHNYARGEGWYVILTEWDPYTSAGKVQMLETVKGLPEYQEIRAIVGSR